MKKDLEIYDEFMAERATLNQDGGTAEEIIRDNPRSTLREELHIRSRGLMVSGNKSELVDRLEGALEEEGLDPMIFEFTIEEGEEEDSSSPSRATPQPSEGARDADV